MPARPVAIGRILLSLGALLTCLEGADQLTHLGEGAITTPTTDFLPPAQSLPADAWLCVMAVACLMLAVGVLASACTVVLATGNALLIATDLQLYSNHRFLLVLLCVWFTFAGSDRALAIRSRLRPDPSAAGVPWWPQLLAVATVSSCYLFAGLSKLNPTFLTGDLIASLSPAWVPAQLAAWLTVPTEIAIGLGLWWSRTRRWSMLMGAGLHLSIIALLGNPVIFTAFALLCFSAYPSAWAWPHQRQAEAAATQVSSRA